LVLTVDRGTFAYSGTAHLTAADTADNQSVVDLIADVQAALNATAYTITSSTDRRESSLGLVMCDLDSFKQMNDSHGHEGGDLALREAVRVIGASVRHSDYVIRMGGDEFLAILVDSSPDKALEVAERIRSSMEANRFVFASVSHTLTLSLGVSVYPTDSEVFEECMRAADIALYAAKEAGCNRVVRCSPRMLEKKA